MSDLIEAVRMFLAAHAKAWVYQHERGEEGRDHLQVRVLRVTCGDLREITDSLPLIGDLRCFIYRCTCSIRASGLSRKSGLLGMLLTEVSLVMPSSADLQSLPDGTAPSPSPESPDPGTTD